MDFLFLPPYTYLIRNEEVRYMNLGNNLFNARKKSSLSQEEVAEKLGGKQADYFEMGNR